MPDRAQTLAGCAETRQTRGIVSPRVAAKRSHGSNRARYDRFFAERKGQSAEPRVRLRASTMASASRHQQDDDHPQSARIDVSAGPRGAGRRRKENGGGVNGGQPSHIGRINFHSAEGRTGPADVARARRFRPEPPVLYRRGVIGWRALAIGAHPVPGHSIRAARTPGLFPADRRRWPVPIPMTIVIGNGVGAHRRFAPLPQHAHDGKRRVRVRSSGGGRRRRVPLIPGAPAPHR